MLKDITTIKLEGANFNSLTDFAFFKSSGDGTTEKKFVKAALVYGKNGTGKSTIAKAYRKLAGEEEIPSITNAFFCDDANNIVSITEEEKKNIFVFDEDYVNKNVRLKEDSLDTIVMLGPLVDLTNEIEKARKDKADAEQDYETQNKISTEYNDANNPKSPKYYIDCMKKTLRGDNSWADRDHIINGTKHNTSVNEETYKRFVHRHPQKKRDELIIEFENTIKKRDDMKAGTFELEASVPSVPQELISFPEENFKLLLSKKIEKPELSEREKYLFDLIQQGKTAELSERQQIFSNKETTQCPYCFQEVTTEYKESFVKSIEKVLSKTVEEHLKNLDALLMSTITFELSDFQKLEGYSNCVKLINELNTAIQCNNELIDKKKENPYEPIDNSNCANIKQLTEKLEIELKKLEEKRLEHNEDSKKTDIINDNLRHINDDIAHYDIESYYIQFINREQDLEKVEEELQRLKNDLEEKKEIVNNLEAKRKNIRLAVNSINECFNYIFLSKDRLEIVCTDGEYRLLSRGKSVKPKEVSVGERNIIGLSYFFTQIFEGKEENSAYTAENLLVIDDPISSYDFENRIGILSFLNYKLSVFLENNKNTRALIMTHDLATISDIEMILKEIVKSCNSKEFKYNVYEITNNMLKKFSIENRYEYTELMKSIYMYACQNATENEIVIGNEIRQVLEAFGTFEFKKGIKEISTDDGILKLLNDEKYETYFKNLMYRLVLHGGSHREEQIKAMKDLRFFSVISENEKRRTARDVLCFIYLLNEQHVTKQLQSKDTPNAINDIKKWCNEIKER